MNDSNGLEVVWSGYMKPGRVKTIPSWDSFKDIAVGRKKTKLA